MQYFIWKEIVLEESRYKRDAHNAETVMEEDGNAVLEVCSFRYNHCNLEIFKCLFSSVNIKKKEKKEMRETGCYAENSLFVLLDSFLVFLVVETLRMAFHPSCVSSPLCRGPAKGPFSV